MYIKIAERLKPYCHLPGSCTVLPGSHYQLQIFPTRLFIYDLSFSTPQLKSEINFDLTGPLKDFTIQNDLEKGEVRVWGKTPLGFLRYRLNSYEKGQGIRLQIDQAPQGALRIFTQEHSWILKPKDVHNFFQMEPVTDHEIFRPLELERLSFGNHKSQDWELIHRRCDLTEIFPIWHRLGQLVPPLASLSDESVGTLTLLQRCQDQMRQNQPEKLASCWTHLFLAGFKSLLVPRLQDDCYQGIIADRAEMLLDVSPLILLTEGSKLIRQLFFQSDESQLKLLPLLPPEFHCGRLLGLQILGGVFSMEWTKKTIRRCEFKVNSEENVHLNVCFRHVKQCRLRKNGTDKGQIIISGQKIDFEKNHHYFFDNFS